MKPYLKENRKFLIILAAIIALNWHFGLDARFTIINLTWVFINLVKI